MEIVEDNSRRKETEMQLGIRREFSTNAPIQHRKYRNLILVWIKKIANQVIYFASENPNIQKYVRQAKDDLPLQGYAQLIEIKIFKIACTLTERVLKIQEFLNVSQDVSQPTMRCKNWSHSNVLYGNYRYLESTLLLLPLAQIPLSIDVVSYFPLSRPEFLALQLERLATSSSLATETTFVDETSTFLWLYPREIMGNPGFPRKLLSSVSLSLSLSVLLALVFFHPSLKFLSLSLSLFDFLVFSWRELLRTITMEFKYKHRSPSNLSPLMTLRDRHRWFIVLKLYHVKCLTSTLLLTYLNKETSWQVHFVEEILSARC